MFSIFKWLGALHYLLLSSLSLQMDSKFSLEEFCSDELPTLLQTKNKHIPGGLDTCQNQKIHTPNKLFKFDIWDIQTSSTASKDSVYGLDKTRSAEAPDLDLSLSQLPKKMISDDENHQRLCYPRRDFNQNIQTFKHVKENPFQLLNKPSSQFSQGPIERSHTGSSRTSWLTLGNSERELENKSKGKLSEVDFNRNHQQVDPTRFWLSLGHENTPQKGQGDIHNQNTDFDHNKMCSPEVTFRDNIRTSTSRKSEEFNSIHPLDHQILQFPKFKASTSMNSPNYLEFETDPTTLGSFGKQQNPDKSLYHIGNTSQNNHKRMRVFGSQEKNDKHPQIQGSEEMPYMGEVEGEALEISTSSKKKKTISKDKQIEGVSHSKYLPPNMYSLDMIKEVGIHQKLLPQDLLTEIQTWFSTLNHNLCERIRGDIPEFRTTGFASKHLKPAVTKAIILTISFLTCIKILHHDQDYDIQNWEERLLKDGWNFIQIIFNQWNTIEWNVLEKTKRHEHIDDLQAEVLHNHLEHVRSKNLTIKYLWSFWKRWYRESRFPNKRLLATETYFVKYIQYSILLHGQIKSPIHLEVILQNFKTIDSIQGHHQMLKQHALQFHWLQRYYSNSPINDHTLQHMMKHIGQFELELLEHHEPVVEWLERLLQDLQNHLIKQGMNDKHTSKSISQCIKATYNRLLPIFLGAIKLMEESKTSVPVKEKDETISNAWSFFKFLLNNWRNLNFKNIFLLEIETKSLEVNHLKESYQLFVEMYKIKPHEHLHLDLISRLHYFQSLSPGDMIDEREFRYHHAKLRRKLVNIFWDLQRELK
ncbi:hypothetical protein DFH28DRAFT_943670 [Melampsora americana]|nr:hypothetical protein DFH28DRAFT_943670 [Melampsora americana]